VTTGDPAELSADDARILGLESSAVTGHTLKLLILEPAAQPLDLDTLRSTVAQRLSAQPKATQLVDTSASVPRWVEADAFDIRDHVRRVPDSDGISGPDLWRIVGGLMSEHLDRSRPLWTFDVIGPLADGREAIAARIHHAMADGIAGVHFLSGVLLDVQPDVPPQNPAHAGSDALSLPAEVRRLPGAALRELGEPGSPSPFDLPISAARELAFTVVPLAEMKAIGKSRPDRATVNDVLLAIIAGGLRRWLPAADTRKRHLRAQVPVSLHHREHGVTPSANQDSFMNVDLPLAEADPLVRLDLISAETRARKAHGDPAVLYDLFHALGRYKPIGSALQHLADSAREFAVAISNVPGPRNTVGVGSRRVLELFSSSEPGAHHALRISAISCGTDIGIGLCTDPNALPGVAGLADAIDDSFTELRTAAPSE
jgi:diacylglycerol O-acyltransferase / wax synthase